MWLQRARSCVDFANSASDAATSELDLSLSLPFVPLFPTFDLCSVSPPAFCFVRLCFVPRALCCLSQAMCLRYGLDAGNMHRADLERQGVCTCDACRRLGQTTHCRGSSNPVCILLLRNAFGSHMSFGVANAAASRECIMLLPAVPRTCHAHPFY